MPIRILHVVTYMGRGGLETMLMNCYRNIDRDKVQFDFLVHRQFRADYDDEIESLGGKIYRLPRLNPADFRYLRALGEFFRQHPEYRIVHSHLDCMSAIPLKAAREAGVSVRIAHSHNSNQDRNWKYFLKQYYMKKIPAEATHFFACSMTAGEYMFPRHKVTAINNGIATKLFAFNPEKHTAIRMELDLENALVVGHVGRFMPQKNHNFLLQVFSEIRKSTENAVLLLVGGGELEEQIRAQAAQLGILDRIIFAGVQSDVSGYYQAMDVFVFPSLYEGLGIVAVEAQAAGLPCVISERVPLECIVTDGLVTVQNLNDSPKAWAEHVLQVSRLPRVDHSHEVKANGYDISATAAWLQEFYSEIGGQA